MFGVTIASQKRIDLFIPPRGFGLSRVFSIVRNVKPRRCTMNFSRSGGITNTVEYSPKANIISSPARFTIFRKSFLPVSTTPMGLSIEGMGSRSAIKQRGDSVKSLLSQEPEEELLGNTSHEEGKPSRGYVHLGGATQNQGNVVGERPCVRQSRIGRDHEGGNRMKDILGQNHLKWEIEHAQGAYEGQSVYKMTNSVEQSPSDESHH
ncbi:serine/threonine-protein kinase [Perkinsela sp. CCAP 1560/4]|nr:serine/threonine-protein kinase [Perkinsela sp. CCAP 1560/4]|eukprot:KNH05647.1 serine/threonine-protein kinase [Perkinsela sp. CCAP 1560/4]